VKSETPEKSATMQEMFASTLKRRNRFYSFFSSVARHIDSSAMPIIKPTQAYLEIKQHMDSCNRFIVHSLCRSGAPSIRPRAHRQTRNRQSLPALRRLLEQPRSNQKVPKNSVAARLDSDIRCSYSVAALIERIISDSVSRMFPSMPGDLIC
jgi:hypothetical protein